MLRSILLTSALLLFGCDGNILNPFAPGEGGGFGIPGEEEPPEEEELPEFARDGITIDFTVDVDGTDVEMEYVISYWVELGDVLNCNQRWSLSGAMTTAPTGCPNCDGRMAFLPNTAADVSEPLQYGTDCDPALIEAAQSNIGLQLVTSQQDQGLADLLELSWMSAAAHQADGGSYDAQGDFTHGLMLQVAASEDSVYEGVILLNDLGGLSQSISLPDVSGNMGGGTGWSPFFFLLRDPLVNDHEGPDLQGTYTAQGVFSVGFAQ